MNAKDKARELVDKYFKTIQGHKYHYVNEAAKQCALIAVNEMLKEHYHLSERGIFWQEVKQEINNL